MADEFLTSWPGPADTDTGMQRQPALDPAVTLADYAASTAASPEPVGRTLRAAAERGFTGEVTFALGTGVRVHCDGGQPYLAERIGDAPLGQRLVSMGVLTDEQLQQGMVRVGDVEHLGRIFDRDRSIDRDAVTAAVELLTDELLTEVATHDAVVTITPYRHHRSGVHRWFVGPGRRSAPRPVDTVPELERPVFEQLPDVSARTTLPSPVAPPFEPPVAEPELRIEWDEPVPGAVMPPPPVPAGEPNALDSAIDIDIDAELERFDADAADWAGASANVAPADAAPGPDAPAGDALPTPSPVTDPEAVAHPATVDSERSTEPTDAIIDPTSVASIEVTETIATPDTAREPTPDAQPDTPAEPVETPDVALHAVPVVSTEAPVTEDSVADARLVDDVVDPDDIAAIVRAAEPIGVAPVADAPSPPAEPIDHFTIVWPDGSEEPALDAASPRPAPVVDEPLSPDAPTSDTSTAASTAPPTPEADVSHAPSSDATPTSATPPLAAEPATPSDGLDLRVPSLNVDRLPEPDADVPDEVADAVRRALAAIERAAAEPETTSRLRSSEIELPDFTMPKLLDRSAVEAQQTASAAPPAAPTESTVVEPVVEPSSPGPLDATAPVIPTAESEQVESPAAGLSPIEPATPTAEPTVARPAFVPTDESAEAPGDVPAPTPAPAEPMSFAPPTEDMSAEAVYARAATAHGASDDTRPAPGQASVVFIEDGDEQGTRKGALQRLIGSLRRSK